MFFGFNFGRVRCCLAVAVLGFQASCIGADAQGLTAPVPMSSGAAGSFSNAPASAVASATAGHADNSIWVLSPNDQIAMTVFQEEDLKTETTVDVNGMVMLPLLGEVKIGGMTLAQATTRIQQLYDEDYLVKPQVNLVVEKFAARHYAVLGQLQRPGSFDFPQNEPVSLLEAIATAGGYTRLGAPSKVSVRRVENGAQQIYHLDADQLAQDLKKKAFQVLPNDVITVGERTF